MTRAVRQRVKELVCTIACLLAWVCGQSGASWRVTAGRRVGTNACTHFLYWTGKESGRVWHLKEEEEQYLLSKYNHVNELK